MTKLRALIVEDDPDFRISIALLVGKQGFEVEQAGTLTEARARLAEKPADLVLLDLSLPDGDGLSLIDEIDDEHAPEFVIMTGDTAAETAIAALRAGALDYLPKPVDRPRLDSILTNVARTRELKHQVSTLRDELRDLGRFGTMVGRSAPMQEVYDLISRVAPTQTTVFITGESGTGKELVAETVHRLSGRSKGPFVALNCGAMSASLIESELFGHEKGSFTGADKRRSGYFEDAAGGTLFLDEITEMPVELQVKLLRVLETGTVTRVGATEPIPVDARVVAATNRNPHEAVAAGELREDLLYRLNVFPIDLPPLRERGEDIVGLAAHFLAQVNVREGSTKRFSEASETRLQQIAWPGNVRELKNAIERAAILADAVIGPNLLPDTDAGPVAADSGAVLEVRVGASIEAVERRLILATLQELDGDKKRAADLLGISLKTLYNRLNVYEAQSEKSD